MEPIYYFAYGSNLNKDQMRYRCPRAQSIGWDYLDSYQLVFRGVADIEQEPDAQVPVGIWRITPDCLDALDHYEGYPDLYTRRKVKVGDYWGWIYLMNRGGYNFPSEFYYQAIADGYKNFNIRPASYLESALALTADRLYRASDDFAFALNRVIN
tara:strand:+ start:724 stop:1188 length:465 start_codon:yes stop_codon:yes gene_type:complete